MTKAKLLLRDKLALNFNSKFSIQQILLKDVAILLMLEDYGIKKTYFAFYDIYCRFYFVQRNSRNSLTILIAKTDFSDMPCELFE